MTSARGASGDTERPTDSTASSPLSSDSDSATAAAPGDVPPAYMSSASWRVGLATGPGEAPPSSAKRQSPLSAGDEAGLGVGFAASMRGSSSASA